MSYLDGKTPVGFQYPPQKVTWLKRDVLLFANSIGVKNEELHLLYELHPNFQVFPTYPILLPFKNTTQEVIDFVAKSKAVTLPGIPKVDTGRVLDGQRKMTFLKPLPPSSEGRNFELRQTCTGVYDKGKSGMVMENTTLLIDTDSNEVYTKMEGSGFAVGQGGWGGPKDAKAVWELQNKNRPQFLAAAWMDGILEHVTPKKPGAATDDSDWKANFDMYIPKYTGPATVNYPPPANTPPTATIEIPTNKEIALLYRLNGDYNPLHASPEFAQKNGFKQPILHGLASWNMTAAALLRTFCNSDPANLKEYQARFSSPVLPGNTLVVELWKTGKKEGEGFEEVIIRVKVKETDKVVLSNGRAVIKSTGGSKL